GVLAEFYRVTVLPDTTCCLLRDCTDRSPATLCEGPGASGRCLPTAERRLQFARDAKTEPVLVRCGHDLYPDRQSVPVEPERHVGSRQAERIEQHRVPDAHNVAERFVVAQGGRRVGGEEKHTIGAEGVLERGVKGCKH
uniref:Uncharacterized protein n=1 Tax=Anopheles melas TaxID=34690 RepID=A0A182TG54_9DIPT